MSRLVSTMKKMPMDYSRMPWGEGQQCPSEAKKIPFEISSSNVAGELLGSIKWFRLDPESNLKLGDVHEIKGLQAKSLSDIRKEHNRQYVVVHRLAQAMKEKKVILEDRGTGNRKIPAWSPYGVLCLTDMVPPPVIEAFLSTILGNRKEFARYLQERLRIDEATVKLPVDRLFLNGKSLICFFREAFFAPYCEHNLREPSVWFNPDAWKMAALMFLFLEEISGFDCMNQGDEQRHFHISEKIVGFFRAQAEQGKPTVFSILENKMKRIQVAQYTSDDEYYNFWKGTQTG